ncbi:hypothetical protein H2203_005082 [Taxawa tesnikishii (nom. ined.)]|nr:hypothetical protein H2203_005082 [Dothideales sp. JES 119]
MHSPADLPYLRTSTRLGGKEQHAQIFDVKFYPYTDPDEDAVFAAVGAADVFICRPSLDPEQSYEVLRWFRDVNKEASLNSLVWSQDPTTGDPLVCVGGANSSRIDVLNVVTGGVARAIRGHGASINDLAVSPLSSAILASGSADHTIRLWNLDPAYEKQPCAAIFGGGGHRDIVLAISFHSNGRYLLSGGQDTMVNLWSVPQCPDANTGTDKPTTVYYPHFSSTEVHHGYIDCVKFHGDLILSRCSKDQTDGQDEKEQAKNYILLWKIDGFSSDDPTPDRPPVPAPGVHTRSAFGKRFQRLLTFDMPYTSQFYIRFSLFDAPGHRPILAMGNLRTRMFFWDLQSLEEAQEGYDEVTAGSKRTGGKRGGRDVSASNRSAMSSERKVDIGDAYAAIEAHKIISSPSNSTGRNNRKDPATDRSRGVIVGNGAWLPATAPW